MPAFDDHSPGLRTTVGSVAVAGFVLAVRLTGWMNRNGGAARNSEFTIAAAYSEYWHQRLALSLPYTQR